MTANGAAAESVQDAIHFTYDDHQAGTAMTEAPGQPNRVRAVREAGAKYAVYIDPAGRAAPSTSCTISSAIPTKSRTSSIIARARRATRRPRLCAAGSPSASTGSASSSGRNLTGARR